MVAVGPFLVPRSKAFAHQRLEELSFEYYPHWASSGLQSEIYADWIRALWAQVMAELASAWKGRSKAIDEWYDGHCEPAVRNELRPAHDELW